MDYPKRKSLRLKEYDYSTEGAYFITICTKDREEILSMITSEETTEISDENSVVGADASVRPNIKLTEIGKITEECWNNINQIYEGVKADKYVVMPNHFHGIIILEKSKRKQDIPSVQKIMQGFKSITTRKCFKYGYKQIWQRTYVDHIIRNEEDYITRCNYIDNNPIKWFEENNA